MASKIKSYTFYVAITPYTVEDSSGEEFNELSVMTAYDDRHKYFYVSLHAGWKSNYGHGCVIMGNNDPLTAPKYVKVKDAPKNSQKTINEMGAALEHAKDAIAWLFDHREWSKLYLAVGNIARNGYVETYRKQMEALINSNNNQNKEDRTMRLNINNNSETNNVQTAAQVNNNETIVSKVDVIGLMNGLKKNGTAKLSDYATPVEDAHEEVESVSVGEVTIDSIMPAMQPVEGSEPAEEKPAVTMPLGDHGTLVIAGVGSDKSKPKRDASGKFVKKGDSQTYRVVLVPSKDGSGCWPKLYGFDSEDAAEKMLKKMAKSIRNSWDRDEQGEKRFYIKGGKKYCDVFQELCNALNAGDKAAIDKACKRTVAIYDGAVADGKAESAAKKAEREAAKAQEKSAKPATGKAEKPAAPAMSDEEQAMFDLFKRFMAGDKEAMAKVGAVLNKAA